LRSSTVPERGGHHCGDVRNRGTMYAHYPVARRRKWPAGSVSPPSLTSPPCSAVAAIAEGTARSLATSSPQPSSLTRKTSTCSKKREEKHRKCRQTTTTSQNSRRSKTGGKHNGTKKQKKARQDSRCTDEKGETDGVRSEKSGRAQEANVRIQLLTATMEIKAAEGWRLRVGGRGSDTTMREGGRRRR